MKKVPIILAVTLACLAALRLSAAAEVTGMSVRVVGLACPFCAFGLEKKLKAVEGVRGVEVSLKPGVVALRVDPHRPPSVDALRKAVQSAGFTPGEVRLTVLGTLRIEDGRVHLDVRNSGQHFVLFEPGMDAGSFDDATRHRMHDLAASHAIVSVHGAVHDHADGPPGLSVDVLERLRPGSDR